MRDLYNPTGTIDPRPFQKERIKQEKKRQRMILSEQAVAARLKQNKPTGEVK